MTQPLIVVSSKTGNTRIVAHGVADERHDRRFRAADRQQKKQRRDETECRDL